MPSVALVAIFVVVAGAATGDARPQNSPAPEPGSEWAAALAEEDDAIRAARLRDLGRDRDGACGSLATFAVRRDDRLRENAVRGLDDFGCAAFADYSPFQHDRSPWVLVALVRAVEHRRVAGMVPFLIDRIEDPRRVVDGDQPRTIGEIARRALRVVSGRSFGYDPSASAPVRAAEVQRWRRWYVEHRDEPRALWLDAGIAEARAGLASPSPALRIEALRQLALIGPPAAPALREALGRDARDLTAGVVCQSDDPPRVTETLACRLLVQNSSDRRVALAPGVEALVEVEPVVVDPAPSPPATRRSRPAQTSFPAPAGRKPIGAGPGPVPADLPGDLAETIIDLAPGEILAREFRVGPVPGAGRYTVRAVLPDRAVAVAAGPAIEASTIVRFEQ